MRRLIQFTFITLPLSFAALHAGEIGHFAPGVLNIRDFAMPEPGFYGVLYNYGYSTDQLNDARGNEINSVHIGRGPGPGVTLGVDVDVDVYAISPTFIWVSDCEIFGAKYGAYIAPSFSNTSIGASLTTQTGSGRRADDSQFGIGDLFVQPLWLGWSQPHFDFTLGYGFYAPIGKYDTETVTFPVIGPLTVEAADNIGYGFWTHQLQGAATWYPWADKRMAISTALTYEVHGEKDDFDLRPGQNLTLNWGVSQFLPLSKDQQLLLEVGPAGYSSWQITDDSGSDAATFPVKDSVHAVGGQLGLTYVPWNAALNFHYFYEFSAEDRFEGQSVGLNFAMKF
ncbi:transporter [Luteolibacter sp. Populi]|uniref:SphA family protein n=1 Tax=Luteolibacter sp. Populi TaxID=3230487 RepID=UPI00346550F6